MSSNAHACLQTLPEQQHVRTLKPYLSSNMHAH